MDWDTCSSILKYLASSMAQKTSGLLVEDLKTANSLLRCAKTMNAVLTFLRPQDKSGSIVVFSDASMNGPQEACILFKLYGKSKKSPMHPIMWHSRKAKNRVYSTIGIEGLACVSGYSVAFYMKHFLSSCLNMKCNTIILTDSKSLWDHLTSTNTEISDKKLQIYIAVLRQAFKEGHINELMWTPGKYQLADCMTKENRVAAEYLRNVLVEGESPYDFDHPKFKSATRIYDYQRKRYQCEHDTTYGNISFHMRCVITCLNIDMLHVPIRVRFTSKDYMS